MGRRRLVRKTLTVRELERAHDELCKQIRRRSRVWGSHGWAIVGSRRALRIEIAVPRLLVDPRHRVEVIWLRSIEVWLKPSVRASLHDVTVTLEATLPRGPKVIEEAPPVSAPLAPGSRIFVDSSETQRAGVACFVEADGDVYLVTCGHVFEPGAANTGVFASGKRVAQLTRNFLEATPQHDAAYCKVLPIGKQLLAKSASAPTWYAGVLAPASGQHKAAVFWPTHEDAGDDAVATTIDSYGACDTTIYNDFWPNLDLCGLVRTDGITVAGDSGSLLAVDDRYYASCSGKPNWSFYTPIHTTLERMRAHFTKVELWQPS